ncbi:armadillo-type protein [Jimgerdemannia flammicorona]|uniref:Armadillo-type protein n=1 Tax=Jimgerdemannia flammicorona TaxID=994334 RepID=A0A433QZT3_9FUNG|nr:armadillo-type protein [Jimgerdemannia flammicorona]
MLFTLKEEHPESAEQFLQPVMAQWIEAFVRILKHRTQGNEELQMAEYGLKMEVVKTLTLTIRSFPKYVVPHLTSILEPIWLDLIHLRERYVNEFVRHEGAVDYETFQDSDGEVIGFETLLFEQFEFFGLAARKKNTRTLFLGPKGDGELLKEVVYMILSYMQMTEEQVETWLTDANQFVADGEDDTYNFNVRIAAEDLLLILLEKFPEKFFDALSFGVQKHLEESNKARTTGNPDWYAFTCLFLYTCVPTGAHKVITLLRTLYSLSLSCCRWKIQEACLLAIGRTSEELIDAIQDKQSGVQFDLAGLFDHVVLEHIKSTEYPFSQGRAFVFASQFARILPANLSNQYVVAAVTALQASAATIPVKISALKAMNNFCQYLNRESVAPYQANILEGACQLLPSATEDSLILVLETLMAAAKVCERILCNPSATESYDQFLIMNFTIYFNHIVAGVVMDLFEELARNQALYPALSARALPLLHSTLTSGTEDSPMLSSAIDLVTALVRGGPSSLPPQYTQQIFLPLMHLLWATEDRDVLQSGEDCLKFLVQKDSTNIVQWRDATGKSGLDYIVQFVAKLLQPAQTESAALFVGDVLVKLIQKTGNNLAPVLPELLNAVVFRLATAESPTFIQVGMRSIIWGLGLIRFWYGLQLNPTLSLQSLVLVFAHLILAQQETVIEFLSNVNIEGHSGLQVVMNAWCENYESFQGYYSLKVSAIALSKMFLSTDPRVQALTVKGDLIVSQSNTAHKINNDIFLGLAPDQYTVLPVPVKIVKILVADLQNSMEAENDEDSIESGDEVVLLFNIIMAMGPQEGTDWEDVDESPFAPAEDYAFLSGQ